MGEDSESDVDVVNLEPGDTPAEDEAPQGQSPDIEPDTQEAELGAADEPDTPAQENQNAGAAQEQDGAQTAEPTVKRGRGRPRKNFTTPVVPTVKRGPGRPKNSELLARFANSHRPSGAPQLLPELAPKPATTPATGRKRGRGRARLSDSPRALAARRPPVERTSRLRVASGPSKRGRGRGRRPRSARRGSDDDDEDDDDDDLDDLLESDEAKSEHKDGSEPEDAPASQVSDPFPSDGELEVKAEEPGEEAHEEAAASKEAVPQEAAAEEEEGPEAEEEAAQPAEASPGQQQPPEPEIPAEIVLERPGGAGSVTVQTDALGDAVAAYLILRAFSWQLRLSPVAFEEYAAALFATHPTPLMDEVHVSLLRALAEDETRAQRAQHALDLALLDAVTWPEYLWDFLRIVADPSGHLSSALAVPQQESTLPRTQGATVAEPIPEQAEAAPGDGGKEEAVEVHHMHAIGQGRLKFANKDAPSNIRALMQRGTFTRRRCLEYYSLPATIKAQILSVLTGYLLDVRSVRGEIDRREMCGQWVAGALGEGGAFAMRTAEERAERAAAASDDEGKEIGVEADGNTDNCCLCNQGGSLLCCDGCPASYHLRCIGEQAKSLPEGEWLCPECALGGRGESGGLRIPCAGLDRARRPCWLAFGALFCSTRPGCDGTGADALEVVDGIPVAVTRLIGADALERASFLRKVKREEKYQRSSLEALSKPPPTEKRATTSAEGYLNRYRNGWAASAAATKAFVDETVRRRGKPVAGKPAIPLAELPVPVPISRFLWPFGQGKGMRPTEKCGVCAHCTRPALRKGCLNPIVRSDNPNEAPELQSKLQTLVNYALKAERDLWGVLDGPWDGPEYANHRRAWSSQVRNATQVETIAQAMLDLEKHLRRTALKPEWDPLAAREVAGAAARPSGPEKPAPGSSGQPSTPAPQQKTASEPPSRQQTPGPAGADTGDTGGRSSRRGRDKVDYREPSMAEILAATAAELNASKSSKSSNMDTAGEEVGAEFDYERDKRIVENEATKNGKHWVVNNRGLWARLTGRFRLPQDVAKRAARQGGRKRVPGLVYAAKKPGIAQRLQWRAAAQAALSCPELALQLRDLDAAVLWEGLKRPAEDGKWAGAEILGRRPARHGPGWHYLLRGGPSDLPEEEKEVANVAQATAVAAAAAPTANGHGPVVAHLPNGVIAPAKAPVMNGPSHPAGLTDAQLSALLIANGMTPIAARAAVEKMSAARAGKEGEPDPIKVLAAENEYGMTNEWLPVATAVIAATDPAKRAKIGGLASLVPSAALYANRLHSGGYAPGGAFPGTPGAAAPGGLECARWVSERALPLWLVRTHEEKARREAAILATRAQQEAEREEKEAARAAARAAAAAAADACTLCGAQWGEAADRDDLWVACGVCNRWYHGACAGATQEDIDALGAAEWECPECQMHRAEQRRAQQEKQRQRKGGQEVQRRGMRIRAGAGKRRAADDGVAAAAAPPERKPPRRRAARLEAEEAEDVGEQEEGTGEGDEEGQAAELYCLCRQPDDPAAPRDFVACDKCEQWFHPECVDTTMEEVADMDAWVCPLCSRRRGGLRPPKQFASTAAMPPAPEKVKVEQPDGALGGPGRKKKKKMKKHLAEADVPEATPVTGLRVKLPRRPDSDANRAPEIEEGEQPKPRGLPKRWRRAAVNAINLVLVLPEAAPFGAPVSDSDAPGYSAVVARPMDLGTLRDGLERREYAHPADAYADVRQVWANCRAYNAEGSDIMRLCKRLEKLLLAAWKEAGLPRKHPKPAAGDADQAAAAPSAVPVDDGVRRKGKRATEAADAAGSPGEGLDAGQAAAALGVVRKVARSKVGALFAQPVTEEQAPGYHSVIARPMDLGTIAHRLEAGHYRSLGAVAADVALVWANCQQFNSEGSEIAAMAAEAQAAFEQRWAKEGLPALSSLGRASKRGRQEAIAVKDEIAEDEQPRRKKRRREEEREQDAGEPLPSFGKKRRRDGAAAAREEAAPAEVEAERGGKRRRVGEESLLAAVAAATAEAPPSSGTGRAGRRKKKKKKGRKVEWPPASAEQLAAAGKVVRAVARGEAGWPFEAPVSDEVAPGYSREIVRPMDLGTIAKALKRGDYTSLGPVLEDVALVWANCRQYNEPTSDLLPLCDAAEADFARRWESAGLPSEPALEPAHAPEEASLPAPSSPTEALTGAERRRQRAELLAIAEAADAAAAADAQPSPVAARGSRGKGPRAAAAHAAELAAAGTPSQTEHTGGQRASRRTPPEAVADAPPSGGRRKHAAQEADLGNRRSSRGRDSTGMEEAGTAQKSSAVAEATGSRRKAKGTVSEPPLSEAPVAAKGLLEKNPSPVKLKVKMKRK
ncbi:probable pH-interacting protein at C-terminar half [Coccomyxa sp. Obi]|nr:probable pH-interacting protein at C-terminar half [Coccomyxa sp. Obi]